VLHVLLAPRNPIFRAIALLLALAGALAFVVRGYHDEREALHFRDFKQPYSSSLCLLHGCDPYSEPDTRAAFLSAGGVDNDRVVFDPYSALYPPFSLALLTPVAALPYPVAHRVWEALTAAAFSIAVLLTAELCLQFEASLPVIVLLALFSLSSTILIMLGQISGLVLALLVIAFSCLIKERLIWLAVLCLVIAVLLKPHDAAIPTLYLLFAGGRWRKAFGWVASISILFAAGSLLWFSSMQSTSHWLPELQANLHGNAAAGSVNNPATGHMQSINLADLQAILAVVHDKASFYNDTAALVSLVILLCWAVLLWRMPNSLSKHLLAIATIACLALLPIYHRQYDTRILLLAFPAVALLLSRRNHRMPGVVGFALLSAATVLTSHQFTNRLQSRDGLAIAHASAAQTLLFYRPIPEILLALCLFFLVALAREARAGHIRNHAGAALDPV
jgi:hypothetical protein